MSKAQRYKQTMNAHYLCGTNCAISFTVNSGCSNKFCGRLRSSINRRWDGWSPNVGKTSHYFLFSQSSVLLESNRSPSLPQLSSRFIPLAWHSGLLCWLLVESIVLVVEAVSKRNIGLEIFFLHRIMTDSTYSPERQAHAVALIQIVFVVKLKSRERL